MVHSMTGYGRGELVVDGRSVTAEVRSVNNRYLDCTVKLPRSYAFAEDAVRARVKETASRGKIEVHISVETVEAQPLTVRLNEPVAAGYLAALHEMAERYGLPEDVGVALLSRFPDVFAVEKKEEDPEAAAQAILAALDQALAAFQEMRAREGEKLKADLLDKLDHLADFTTQVEKLSPKTLEAYRQRLYAKLSEVLGNTQIDESRILTEAAIFADKVAVDEETVRLRSHIGQLREMLDKGGATGRKLDFLIQEFNREANTIGSKCSDIDIARHVVDMKAEIEKIREQVQNIE